MIPLRAFLASLLILSGLALAASPAAANDPCDGWTLWDEAVVVGLYTGPCVGAYAGQALWPCYQVHWGVHTNAAGVGGHNTCGGGAYVAPGNADEVPGEIVDWLYRTGILG